MKTLAYVTALTALTVVGAHAQTAYEASSVTSSETVDGVTTQVTTDYVSATSITPVEATTGTTYGTTTTIGDAPATPELTAASTVKVKLPDGKLIDVADSDDAPWNKDSQLQGYDRFTFDPVTGAFVAGKGDDKFAGNWDENGNRVVKKAPAPKKKKKVVVEAPVEEPAAETPAVVEPAVETPAAEAPATDSPDEMVPAIVSGTM